jgi:hypothetical protein
MKASVLLLFLFIGLQAIAQQGVVSFDSNPKEVSAQAKKNGVMAFKVSDDAATMDVVKERLAYYPQYFSVNKLEQKKDGIYMELKMVSEDPSNLRVVYRFFSSFQLSTVKCGNETYSLEEFFKEFIF